MQSCSLREKMGLALLVFAFACCVLNHPIPWVGQALGRIERRKWTTSELEKCHGIALTSKQWFPQGKTPFPDPKVGAWHQLHLMNWLIGNRANTPNWNQNLARDWPYCGLKIWTWFGHLCLKYHIQCSDIAWTVFWTVPVFSFGFEQLKSLHKVQVQEVHVLAILDPNMYQVWGVDYMTFQMLKLSSGFPREFSFYFFHARCGCDICCRIKSKSNEVFDKWIQRQNDVRTFWVFNYWFDKPTMAVYSGDS